MWRDLSREDACLERKTHGCGDGEGGRHGKKLVLFAPCTLHAVLIVSVFLRALHSFAHIPPPGLTPGQARFMLLAPGAIAVVGFLTARWESVLPPGLRRRFSKLTLSRFLRRDSNYIYIYIYIL